LKGRKLLTSAARNANADRRPTFTQFTAPQSIGIGAFLDDRQIAILRSTVVLVLHMKPMDRR
jgi:hypothetical protein